MFNIFGSVNSSLSRCFSFVVQAILEGSVTLEMEVKPRYLVPDTNCFIEKLDIIKALIDSTSYTFMVPLIGEDWVPLFLDRRSSGEFDRSSQIYNFQPSF